MQLTEEKLKLAKEALKAIIFESAEKSIAKDIAKKTLEEIKRIKQIQNERVKALANSKE